ncbi:MAG: hypothetical protein L0211_13920 [Planctomycetaceae bacterium]|nr:hypothetical protein [Planctomycetaceae bacterium]
MTRRCFITVSCSCSIIALVLSGCVGEVMQQAQQAANREQLFNDLKALGLARFSFHDANQRFPNSWEELESAGAPAGLRQKLEAEGYTVVMGMQIRDFMAGTSRSMVVFRRDAAQKGGTVLMCDGSVHQLTADEFNEYWKDQEPTMKQAIFSEPPASAAEAPAGGRSSPPLPPTGNSSASPPPPG